MFHFKESSALLQYDSSGEPCDNPMEIAGCMKQHLTVFKLTKKVFCKEYICDCTCCLQFDFKNCLNENAVDNDEDDAGLEELDKEIDQTKQIFNFIIVLSFVSLFSESTIEPLSFVQITGKCIAEEDISDPSGHFVLKGMLYFQRLYLKAVCSRYTKVKKFLTIPAKAVMTPDEIYDTYVDFSNDPEYILINAIC